MKNEPPNVRKPPVGAVLELHKQGVRGWCGWCGLAVEEKTEVRGWLKFWHDACAEEMAIIEQPDRARRAVYRRDHGVCCDCGEDWSQMSVFRPAYPVKPQRLVDAPDPDRYSPGPTPGTWCFVSSWGGLAVVELVAISLWHVDHKIPLWKVRHMPALQRIEYFKLPNLVTRCHRCHGFKTKNEAPERAKFKAQAKDKEEGPSRPKSKWASRPFQKGKKPWPKRKMNPQR